jgi:hypothetical protein
MHDQPVHLLGQYNLAREPARPPRAAGKIEHVLFIGTGRQQFFEPVFGDDNMAGGTGHLSLASSFQRLPSTLRDIKQTIARICLHCLCGFAIGADEMNFQANCLSAAALINAAACSISSTVV